MTGWGRWAVAVAVMLPMMSSPAKAQITEADTGWPREIVTDSGTMIIYQPQPDRFDGMTPRERGQQQVQKYNNGAGRAPQQSQPRPAPQARPTPSGGAGGRR